MENYFLTKIGTKRKDILTKNEISFCDMEIDGRKGVVIGQDDIDKALSILNRKAVIAKPTPYDGISEITTTVISKGEEREGPIEIPKIAKGTEVIIDDWRGYQSKKFKAITEEVLLSLIKKDIHLSVPHAETIRPQKDGKFHIFIWSSPVNERSCYPPEKMWGYHVSCRDRTFSPSGQGTPILDDTGYAVAELVGDNLYIHHDICDEGANSELSIYRRLLEEVVVEISLSPKEKEERQKKLAEEKLKRSREAYIKECAGRLKIDLKNLQKDAADAKEKVEKYQKALVTEIRRLQESEAKLKYLESDDSGKSEKYGLEFDKLIGLPKITSVQVSDHTVWVFTDTLFCDNPRTKKTHEIGKFRIEIYTNGSNNGIRWFNLTRQVSGYKSGMQAPHIFPKGNACLGNAEEVIPELIANYEFSAVAMLAIQFVESVNVNDDAGKYIYKWPIAKKQEEKGGNKS